MSAATDDFTQVHMGMGDMRSQIINAFLFLQFADNERNTNA